MRAVSPSKKSPDWAQLLVDAVNTPGIISSAYSRFWNYSVGNQLLAMFECLQRGLELGPINTFKGWLELGRHVKKGERAITLCLPLSIKKKEGTDKTADKVPDDTAQRITIFVYKPRWFVLSQTEGDPYIPTELPQWSEANALAALKIERITFDDPNGNTQGFARQRKVAVSPVAEHHHTTLFHELAHIVLGHTVEGPLDDHDRTPRNIREVEAECVALICCESLNLPGVPECRGYIQHWLRMKHGSAPAIPHANVQRIFRAADSILKAGHPKAADVSVVAVSP